MDNQAFFNAFTRDRVDEYLNSLSDMYDGVLVSFDVQDRKWWHTWFRPQQDPKPRWTISFYVEDSTITGVGETFTAAVENAQTNFTTVQDRHKVRLWST